MMSCVVRFRSTRLARFTAVAALGLSIGLMACSPGVTQPSCPALVRTLHDEHWRSDVVRWADQSVLGRTFSSSAFRAGRLAGPGLKTATLDPGRAGVAVPDMLKGYELRVMSDRTQPVTLLYLGMGRYRGVLVGASDLEAYAGNRDIDLGKIKRVGRVGVVCYEESPVPVGGVNGDGGVGRGH